MKKDFFFMVHCGSLYWECCFRWFDQWCWCRVVVGDWFNVFIDLLMR